MRRLRFFGARRNGLLPICVPIRFRGGARKDINPRKKPARQFFTAPPSFQGSVKAIT
jgi:hypothetical protein